MAKKLFITGTDTEVGKTYVSGLILKKLQEDGASAAYYKAAMSGNDRCDDGQIIPGDACIIQEISGIKQPLEEMCPYIYENAYSPHLASRIEGNPVTMEGVLGGLEEACKHYDYVTMEGSGGILCPLSFDEEEIWLPDVIKAGKFPCILVADAGLGTINHVGLTASYMEKEGIPLKGIIFNFFDPEDSVHQDNVVMCEHISGVKVLACIEKGDQDLKLSVDQLKALYE